MPIVKDANAGNCYQAAFHMILDMPEDATLVHGYPRHTGGQWLGRKFGHAWVEREVDGITWVYDHQISDPIPAALYYAVGQIDPKECKRYTRRQAARHALRTEHYGVWSKPPRDAIFADSQ